MTLSTSIAAESFLPVSVPIVSAEGLNYLNTSNWFWTADLLAGFTFALVLLVSGRGAKLYNHTLRITGRRRYLSLALFTIIYFSVDFVLHLPIDFLWDRAHDRLVGTTHETSVAWLIPKIGEWILTVVPEAIASSLLYLITQKFRRSWWLIAAAISSIAAFIFLIGEPFTQVYNPLGRSSIEQRIAELAGRVGVPQGSIVVQHCDPADSCPEGRVIGLGPTRLMILNDALLAKNPENWTLQMVAHESKHFSMDDNLKAFFLLSALSFFVFWLIGFCGRLFLLRHSARFGFSELGCPASMPFIVCVGYMAYLFALPPVNAFRQHVEFEADRFGLELNQDNESLARIVASWTTAPNNRVPNPDWFYRVFRSSHPTDAERIHFANTYHPWLEGKPL